MKRNNKESTTINQKNIQNQLEEAGNDLSISNKRVLVEIKENHPELLFAQTFCYFANENEWPFTELIEEGKKAIAKFPANEATRIVKDWMVGPSWKMLSDMEKEVVQLFLRIVKPTKKPSGKRSRH